MLALVSGFLRNRPNRRQATNRSSSTEKEEEGTRPDPPVVAMLESDPKRADPNEYDKFCSPDKELVEALEESQKSQQQQQQQTQATQIGTPPSDSTTTRAPIMEQQHNSPDQSSPPPRKQPAPVISLSPVVDSSRASAISHEDGEIKEDHPPLLSGVLQEESGGGGSKKRPRSNSHESESAQEEPYEPSVLTQMVKEAKTTYGEDVEEKRQRMQRERMLGHLLGLRQHMENTFIRDLFQRHRLPRTSEGKKKLFDSINLLGRSRVVPPNLIDAMHQIRIYGNYAAHDDGKLPSKTIVERDVTRYVELKKAFLHQQQRHHAPLRGSNSTNDRRVYDPPCL